MIHTGDCVEVMATMDAASVDAIVTDPPYGLEFMGKEWDHGAPGIPFWSAMLRIAKPGAYLLSFGGTRTYHRMACATEDAGWIIRDCLVWAYASGFPKSRALLKPAWEPILMARKPGPLRELAIDACRISGVPGDGRWGIGIESPNRGPFSSGSAPMIADEVASGRWPANLILTDAIFDGDTPGVVGGGEQVSRGPAVNNRLSEWSFTSYPGTPEGADLIGYGDSGTYSRFFSLPEGTMGACYYCGRARVADETSSPGRRADATAPSRAPIERDGTLDSTDLGQFSLGLSETGRAISATAHESSPERERTTTSRSRRPVSHAVPRLTSTDITTTTGDRWTCELCAELVTTGRIQLPERQFGREPLPVEGPDYPRILIIPKADRAEREPVLPSGLAKGGLAFDDYNLKVGNGEGRPRENVHPTVKPLDLMRHLVRLVTPTGGVVLDPFLGSGTTAIAAEMEGFAWVGIEREPEYVAIAEARLNGTQKGLGLPA